MEVISDPLNQSSLPGVPLWREFSYQWALKSRNFYSLAANKSKIIDRRFFPWKAFDSVFICRVHSEMGVYYQSYETWRISFCMESMIGIRKLQFYLKQVLGNSQANLFRSNQREIEFS